MRNPLFISESKKRRKPKKGSVLFKGENIMDQGKVELEKLKSAKFARSYKEQNGVDFHLDKDKKLPASILIFVVFILLLLI